MHRLDRFFECAIPRLRGFQYKECFLCFHNFSLPMINRLNHWDDIRTSSQPRTHHSFANLDSFFPIAHRNQNNKDRY